MFDATAPSSKLVVEKLKEPLVLDRLLLIARRRAGPGIEANDLLDLAIERALDPHDAPWDPNRGPFLTHMTYVMRQSLDRKLRKASAKYESLQGDLYDLPDAIDTEPPPDEELDQRRRAVHWQSVLAEVLARLGDKQPVARQVLDLTARGTDDPAEQAQIIGCDVKDVYQARKIIKYHGTAVVHEREVAERTRMSGLREADANRKTEATP